MAITEFPISQSGSFGIVTHTADTLPALNITNNGTGAAISINGTALTDASGNFSGSVLGMYNVKTYGAKGNGTTDDTTAIQNAINAASTNGGVVFMPPGSYLISSTLKVLSAYVSIIGSGQEVSVVTTTTSNIDGLQIGNTQVSPYSQLNGIVLRDFSINLPNASTNTCLNVTGMGVGGQILNVKCKQGAYGAILEDIDRCTFQNLEAVNYNTAGIICRQGYNNTWGTVSFINCNSVGNTASTINWQFDADASQGSPNPFDRVSLINCHFYCNTGLASTIGVKFLVGCYATSFINCLWENPLQHMNIASGAEADFNLIACSYINNNYGSTPTTDTVYIDNYSQISVYDCKFQQSQNVFNGAGGNPRVALFGQNKSGGNITTIFAGNYGAKHGTDTEFAGDGVLAMGINNERLSYGFFQNIANLATLTYKKESSASPGSSYGIDCSNYGYAKLTLSANCTLSFNNPTDSQELYLIVVQPASGGPWTVTFPGTVKWAGGTAPTQASTAGHADVYTFIYDGDLSIWRGQFWTNYAA